MLPALVFTLSLTVQQTAAQPAAPSAPAAEPAPQTQPKLLGYTLASYVAASRLHDNRHYLSDVVFGAAVGSIAGRTVVHHASDYWAVLPVSVPGGVAIVAMRTR